MSNNFRKDLSNTYNHFIKYTISNKIINFFLTIVENMPILIALDFMWNDDYLSKIFSPLYYLAPHFYLDRLNTYFPNECSLAIEKQNPNGKAIDAQNSNRTINTNNFFRFISENLNTTSNISLNNFTNPISNNSQIPETGNVTEEPSLYFPENTKIPIFFFESKIMEFDNTFCIYNPTIMIIFYILITLIIIFFFLLGKFNPNKTKNSCFNKSFVFFMTNFINICTRPLGYLFFLVLFNSPIIMLYQTDFIKQEYLQIKTIYSIISLIFFLIFLVFKILFIKFFNNSFYYEEYPYDFFSTFDSNKLLIIKIILGLKFNFDRLLGFRFIMFVNYFLGTLIFIRMASTIFNRNLIINNLSQKILMNFFSCFFCIYLTIKVLNNIYELNKPTLIVKVIEILLIASVLIILFTLLLPISEEFVFNKKEDLIPEILRFFFLSKKILKDLSKQKANWNLTGNSNKSKKY